MTNKVMDMEVEVIEDINEKIVEEIKKAISDYEEKHIRAAEKFEADYSDKNMGSKEYRDALDVYDEHDNFLRNLLLIKIYMILQQSA